MRKIILTLSICALIPLVSTAVVYADNDEEELEYIEEETNDTEEEYSDEENNEEYVEDVSENGSEDVVVAENRNVVKRMSCDEIKKEMDRLNSESELDEDGAKRLAGLTSDYRSRCAKKAMGRAKMRIKTATNNMADNVSVAANDVNSVCDKPDANGCCPGETYTNLGELGFNCCTENNERCFPPMQVLKNVQLCEDGTKPDKNGCCTGETYTNLGDLGFNCCLSDKVTCFPPIK